MILDILTAVIIITSMVLACRRGLTETVIHTAGWFVSLALSFFLTPAFKAFLMDNTDCYGQIYGRINEKVSLMLTPSEMQSDLPSIIQNSFAEFFNTLSDSLSDALALLSLSVLSFLLLTLIFNLVFCIFSRACSKKHNHGIIGALDGFLGMLLGFIKGLVFVFLLLALLVPVSSMASPEAAASVFETLENSVIASELYNNNLIMLIIQDLL
ncbi:MAG: CvpA family protein [Anaerovoracaceae bacterium]